MLPAAGDRRLLVALLAAPLIGLLGVIAAELVPDDRIADRLSEALTLDQWNAEERTFSPLGTTTDHFGECVAMTVGLGDAVGDDIVTTALSSPASVGCARAAVEIERYAETGSLSPQPGYLRYWHGYGIITRPALAFVGVTGARWLSFAILAGGIVGMAGAVRKRLGWPVAALMVAPALLTTDMIIGGLSLAHGLGLASAWFGGWLAFDQVARRPGWPTAFLAAALAGAINAYVDLMIAIPASLALASCGAALGVAARCGAWEARRTATAVAAAVGGWAVGLGAMWSSKWVLAAAMLGSQDVIDNVRNQIRFRTVGEFDGVAGSPIHGLTKNVRFWWEQPFTQLVVLVVVVILVVTASRRATWSRLPGALGCVGISAVAVAAWYVALSNHNQIHYWLAYRSLAVLFGASAAVLFVAVSARGEPQQMSPDELGEPATATSDVA